MVDSFCIVAPIGLGALCLVLVFLFSVHVFCVFLVLQSFDGKGKRKIAC